MASPSAISPESRDEPRIRTAPLLAAVLLPLVAAACTVTPLSRRIGIGTEAYVIFVGEGRTGDTDLFAVTPAGGRPMQFTFTRAAESAPALAPGGVVVAFLRKTESEDARHLIFLNLLNGTEREVILPAALGNPEAVGWSADGITLYVRTTTGLVAVTPPPDAPSPRAVTGNETARADSALAVLLGRPVIAKVLDCESGDVFADTGRTLCTETADGMQQQLAIGVHDPFRWGSDSVAWFASGEIHVRPLGGGRPRRVDWSRPPASPRQATYFQPEAP